MPYGFKAEGINGIVLTMVNPSQSIAEIEFPVGNYSTASVLFSDGGFKPVISNKKIQLGPEQMVIVGLDEYAAEKYQLGTDETIQIPISIQQIEAVFKSSMNNIIEAAIKVPPGKDIRIIVQQFDSYGFPYRSWGGAPPDGKKMNEFLKIIVKQGNKIIPQFI